MKLLEEKIRTEGEFLGNNILKVDSFLNHQIDTNFMQEIGKEFATHFKDKRITKVVTIESSGIAPAFATASLLKVPLLVFKKQTSKILDTNVYQTEVISYTKGTTYPLVVSKKFLDPSDSILIIDDFLANGEAASAVIRILQLVPAEIAGIGIVIEKSFQPGRKKLEQQGFEVYSLARISKLENNTIEFISQ